MRYCLWIVGSFLTLACHQAASTGTEPCSKAGRTAIEAQTPVSKPAHGNLDEVDPAMPHSKKLFTLSDVNDHGDQCRAVLGPLPTVSCPDSPLLPVTVNGHVMTYEKGGFYEDGKSTEWKPEKGCDHPGLIGLLFKPTADATPHEGCLPNARLGSWRNGEVTWAWTCHYFGGYHEKEDKFDFITLIGNNRLTGETCYFSHNFGFEEKRRSIGKDLVPPGGWHSHSESERAEAKAFWEPADDFGCLECHGGNHPWLVTPHTNQRRVTGDGSMELLPEMKRAKRLDPGNHFRLIGTVHNLSISKTQSKEHRPKAIYPKNDDGTRDGTCTRCHVLTDQENFLRLARLSVGLGEIPKYADKTKGFVSDPKPWMPPDNDGSPDMAVKAQAAVKRYERAFTDPKWRAGEAEILAPCPAPEKLPSTNVRVEGSEGAKKLVWNYKNDLGQVPLRDDVRFQVTLRSSGGSSCVIRDIAPESLGSPTWHFTHPAAAGEHYTYSIQPYRYCFDESVYQYAEETKVEK